MTSPYARELRMQLAHLDRLILDEKIRGADGEEVSHNGKKYRKKHLGYFANYSRGSMLSNG